MSAHDELAILGGPPVLPEPLVPYRSVGAAEAEAVAAVIELLHGNAAPIELTEQVTI